MKLKLISQRPFLGAFLIIFSVFIDFRAESRSVSGIVLDSETNIAIPNVVVRISELSRTITTSEEGTFDLDDTDYGTYTFILNHIGYVENVSVIDVNDNTEQILVFYLIPKNIELDPIIISDYRSFSKFDDLQELSNVLKGKELQKQLGLTLASTLKNEAGLAIRSMGPAPSRPVIRGLGSNRVLISEDDIKTIDLSATSPDHAVTIDPFTISRIEVLRGPKVLTQTSTTIGGIVNVVRNDIPKIIHEGITGQLGIFGETVNSGYLGFLSLEIPFDPLVIKGEVSGRKTMDLDTPVGELKNSSSTNLNYNFASSYIFDNNYI
ncbi:MAG: TonB-dependent receptor plug domain-containing protein, partial [Melioribacteraceae bacterium]|nr:TonB-dependent receptor plug domain-containing protein [Melioribacteraceae bacterium]